MAKLYNVILYFSISLVKVAHISTEVNMQYILYVIFMGSKMIYIYKNPNGVVSNLLLKRSVSLG